MGIVDLSPSAARLVTAAEEAELWARARAASASLSVVANTAGGFTGLIAGLGPAGMARADDPYRAGLAALERVEVAA